MTRKEIAAVLAAAGLKPRHEFGQNFMVDENILAAIVAAGDVRDGDIVLEVGPGVGNLTRLLSRAADSGAVLTVDIDFKLLPAAKEHHKELTNVTWMNADVLAGKHQVEPAVIQSLRELRQAHPHGEMKLVSNLPYNAASPLIAELLVEMWKAKDERQKTKDERNIGEVFFSRMAFTVQWEVGLRMAAKPDSRDYGPLGIIIQSMADVEIVRKIPPGAFWPPPKIHSALVVVKPDKTRIADIRDALAFQGLLAGIFSHRRQTLGNGLKHHLGERWNPDFKRQYAAAGFDLLKRPENLSVPELLSLERLTASLL